MYDEVIINCFLSYIVRMKLLVSKKFFELFLTNVHSSIYKYL